MEDVNYEKTLRYLNTDLLLTAPVDLTALAHAIVSGAADASIICLYVGHSDGVGYQAHFETFDTEAGYPSPEESIHALLNVIETLAGDLQLTWKLCSKRTLDIGYSSGTSTAHLSHSISTFTLARMQALELDMAITIYPMADYCA